MKIWNGLLVKMYNHVISWQWLNLNKSFCRKIRKMLFHNICYECEASFGALNSQRVFYVIRCPQETMGLFGLFNYVVFHLKIAEKKGAEPVVDWQYYPNSGLSEDKLVGKDNAWEYYFEQPTGITLKEVYQSKNVIMSSGNGMDSLSETHDSAELLNSNRLINKYIRLNKVTADYIDEIYCRLGMGNSRVLGVLCRGTDFTQAKPKGHSVCPSVDETISTIEEKQIEWGAFEKIFLATEDDKIFCKMKEYFGERLIYCQNHRIDNAQGKWLNELYDNEEYKGKKCERMREYLAAIYLLARSDALIAPNVGGTLGAMRIKGIYENCYIFQMGIYE